MVANIIYTRDSLTLHRSTEAKGHRLNFEGQLANDENKKYDWASLTRAVPQTKHQSNGERSD